MKKDIEWLKEEAMNLYPSHSEVYEHPDYITVEKVDLINNFIDLIYQLDEPEKQVIPQFVADYIEKWKNGSLSIREWFDFNYGNEEDEEVYKWLYDNDYEENMKREHLLIDAIRYGYEVETEKKYRVRAGNRYVRFNLDGSIIGVKKDNSIVCLERLSKLPFDYKKAVESGIITLEEVTE